MTVKKQKDGELNNFEYLSLFMTESVRQYEELVVDQYRLRNRARFVFLSVAGLGLTVFQGINTLPENKIKLILIGVAIAGFVGCLILLLKIEWPKVITTNTFTHDEQFDKIRCEKPLDDSDLRKMIQKIHSDIEDYNSKLFQEHGIYENLIRIAIALIIILGTIQKL